MWPDDNHGLFDIQIFEIPLRYRRQAVSTVIETGPHKVTVEDYAHAIDSLMGTIYTCDFFSDKIYATTLNGAIKQVFDGTVLGFTKPAAVSVYNGEVFILDYNYGVWVFNLDGVFQRKWAVPTAPPYYNPQVELTSLVIYNGEVYVANGNNYRIQVYDTLGNPLRDFAVNGGPLAMCIYESVIYVGFSSQPPMQNLDLSGNSLLEWGTQSQDPGGIWGPESITVYGGQLYISDQSNGRIQIFSLSGVYISPYLSGIYSYGIAGYLGNEVYMVTGNQNEVYLADNTFHRSWVTPPGAGGQLRGIFITDFSLD